jgi:hypothetical protein
MPSCILSGAEEHEDDAAGHCEKAAGRDDGHALSEPLITLFAGSNQCVLPSNKDEKGASQRQHNACLPDNFVHDESFLLTTEIFSRASSPHMYMN